MKQYITLNITYYITRYFLTNTLFKILLTLLFTLLFRRFLDITSFDTAQVYCMDESTTFIPKPKRVMFDPSIDQDDNAHYKNRLMRAKHSLINYKHNLISYKYEIKILKKTIVEQDNKYLDTQVLNERLYEQVEFLQRENKILTRDLAIAQSKLSRFGRMVSHMEERGISFNFLKRSKK